jgi:hypothetical protein
LKVGGSQYIYVLLDPFTYAKCSHVKDQLGFATSLIIWFPFLGVLLCEGLSRVLWWWSTTAFYLLDSKCFNHDHLHNVHILNLFQDTAKGLRVGLPDCDLFLKER